MSTSHVLNEIVFTAESPPISLARSDGTDISGRSMDFSLMAFKVSRRSEVVTPHVDIGHL